MKKLSARNKGLLTGLVIVILSAVVYLTTGNFDNSILLAAYIIYAAGIIWSLYSFYRSEQEHKSFKNYFQEGFKCYIVVTFIMVMVTFLFLKFNVTLQNEMIEFQRQQLRLNANYSEPDIEEKLATYKKFILPGYTMSTILSYLGVGTLVTVITSFFLGNLKQQVIVTKK